MCVQPHQSHQAAHGYMSWVYVDRRAAAQKPFNEMQNPFKKVHANTGALEAPALSPSSTAGLLLKLISMSTLMLVQGDETAIAGMLHGDGRVLANALDENRRRCVQLPGRVSGTVSYLSAASWLLRQRLCRIIVPPWSGVSVLSCLRSMKHTSFKKVLRILCQVVLEGRCRGREGRCVSGKGNIQVQIYPPNCISESEETPWCISRSTCTCRSKTFMIQQ